MMRRNGLGCSLEESLEYHKVVRLRSVVLEIKVPDSIPARAISRPLYRLAVMPPDALAEKAEQLHRRPVVRELRGGHIFTLRRVCTP